MGFFELIKNSLLALVFPRRALSRCTDRPVAYGFVIPFLFVGGVAWIHLHGYLLFTEPIWSNYPRWFFYSILFGLFPIFSWLAAALALWFLHWYAGGSRSLYFVEQGTFFLLFIWLVMPVFDVLHASIPVFLVKVPLFGVHPIHFSHIFALAAIPPQAFFLFRALLPQWSARAILAAALLILPVAKFIIEDAGFLLEEFLYRVQVIGGKYEDYVFGFIVGSFFWFIYACIRAALFSWTHLRRWILLGSLGIFFLCLDVALLLLVPPKYPGYATDSGFLDSSEDGIAKTEDFVFEDALHFDFDPALTPVKELRCIVRVFKGTALREVSRSPARARCDIASGPGSGEGEFRLEGESWKAFRAGDILTTVWNDPVELGRLTERNNDIRVHLETAPGDIVVFSGVWVEAAR